MSNTMKPLSNNVLVRTESYMLALLQRLMARENHAGFTIPAIPVGQEWSSEQQNGLIEALLMMPKIHLPAIFVKESHLGALTVINRIAMLTCILGFAAHGTTVTSEGNPEIHGKTFGELSYRLQNRFLDVVLSFQIIDAKTSESDSEALMQRVNSWT